MYSALSSRPSNVRVTSTRPSTWGRQHVDNVEGMVPYVGRENRFIRGIYLFQIGWIEKVLPEIVLQVPELSEGVLLS